MIRLREEMQTEKPTMLNYNKDAHIIFEVFFLIYGLVTAKN
jgi:hypothetical protein